MNIGLWTRNCSVTSLEADPGYLKMREPEANEHGYDVINTSFGYEYLAMSGT